LLLLTFTRRAALEMTRRAQQILVASQRDSCRLAPGYRAEMMALDPETVVLGGFMPLPVIEALASRLEPLHLSVSSTSARIAPRILVGAAGKDTSVLGAAALPVFSETNPQFDVLQKPIG